MDSHCQLMAGFQSLKVDYGSDNTITEFPYPGHVEELMDVVLLIKVSSLQKKKCRAAVVVVVAGAGGVI